MRLSVQRRTTTAVARSALLASVAACVFWLAIAMPAMPADLLKRLQAEASATGRAAWGHWGLDPANYHGWKTHSNRLIPAYTFGISLDAVKGERSLYRDRERLAELYGRLPDGTLNPQAEYFDQTDIAALQRAAFKAGKKYIVLVIFDGMDWQTTWAAATYYSGRVEYREGRGTGLAFQDYRGAPTDLGWFVTSPHNDGTKYDASTQSVQNPGGELPGGYDWLLGGDAPWKSGTSDSYLIAELPGRKHAYTDSAASATSMCAGIKTYNAAVNVDAAGNQVATVAHEMQAEGRAIGVVTSVPISHATPACAYAHNVSRDDYQDLTRDLLGLPSVSHPSEPLAGVDVLIGGGWGEIALVDSDQGNNYRPLNRYITSADRRTINANHGGKYVVAERTSRRPGAEVLKAAAQEAAERQQRLFGYFGVAITGHLPFRTADGNYDPVPGINRIAEPYSKADVFENPTLADMTRAALQVLERNEKGFWLMVEAGDVDWANHDDNLDNSIGAVKSGDDAFRAITEWVEAHDAWGDTAVIVTADHGHFLVLDQPEALLSAEVRSP